MEIVKMNEEVSKIFLMLAAYVVNQLLRGYALLFGAQHDRSAVSIICTDVDAVVASEIL